MAKKPKCDCPKPGLSAPFYMLTYGDMMTLLMCFFVLLFAMSTVDNVKFQAQVAIMQGSLGISKLYQHAPMQKNLPSPSVKQSVRVVNRSKVSETDDTTDSQGVSPTADSKQRQNEDESRHLLTSLGTSDRLDVMLEDDEIILVLPTYGLFRRGDWKIDVTAPEVREAVDLYRTLASQIAGLANYDVYFVGHTDTMPTWNRDDPNAPQSAMELGFRRAIAVYEYFFSKDLLDRTRVTFASQGDNVPIIPNATLDSELRKNRRVQIHLKRKPNAA